MKSISKTLYIITITALSSMALASEYKIIFNNTGIKGNLPEKDFKPANCQQIIEDDAQSQSGEYTIYPSNHSDAGVEVYCDMNYDGGGWTLLMGNNSPANFINIDNYDSEDVAFKTATSIGTERISCNNGRQGVSIVGNSLGVDYNNAYLNIEWNGNGYVDQCETGGGDGLYNNGANIADGETTFSGTVSDIENIDGTCRCATGNYQGGETSGYMMVR